MQLIKYIFGEKVIIGCGLTEEIATDLTLLHNYLRYIFISN